MESRPNFSKSLLDFLKVFEPYRRDFFNKRLKSSSKYSKDVSRVYRELESFSAGGKKIRGYLVWLGYRAAAGKDLNKILPISLAFELAHAFFLIHDDFMDRSATRHGKPTIHKVYEKQYGAHFGESMSVLVGDIACIEAFSQVKSSGFSNESKIAFEREFEKVLLETAYGQSLDLSFSFARPTLSQVWQVADLKAARYSIVGPLVCGSRLGKVSDKQVKGLVDFGLNSGVAFQIKDDILGVFGNEKILGKSVISDMQEGKNTILIYKTREMASRGDVLKLDRIWGNPKSGKKDLELVGDIIERSGSLGWCERENQRLISKAKLSIGRITTDEELVQIFSQIADFVINRLK